MELSRPLQVASNALLSLCLGLSCIGETRAHGGVAFEDDQCVINVGFLRAHFTIFQPDTRASREFCEDVPDATWSVFIMAYQHNLLHTMPVDFRIIRDVTGFGRFANWQDVQAIPDLEAVTIYYQPPQIEPSGYFRAGHTFTQPGDYIGIVTAHHLETDRQYNAVFYFEVGGPNTLFVILLGVLAIAGGYFIMRSRYFRGEWRA